MARPPRIEIAGGIYHVIARGNERRAIFRDNNDRAAFLELLAKTLERHRWELLAYCLMNNHYHLLVLTPEPDLKRGMHYVNACYAQRFNRRHRRVGHLFQGRYKAILVQDDKHLLAAARYIVRNPVRAGICATPAEWPWSGYRATCGLKPRGFVRADRILALFHTDRARARALYRVFIEHADDETTEPRHPLIDGDDEYIARHLALIEPSPEHANGTLRPSPTPLTNLIPDEPSPDQLASAHAQGHSLAAIAAHLGVNKSTVSRRLRRAATIET
jgi:putative transposase